MLYIWNNVFINKRELLLQVMVDGFIWRMNDFGRFEAVLKVDDILLEPADQAPIATGTIIEKRGGVQ